MLSPSHINLSGRKILSGRLIFMEAAEPFAAQFAQYEDGSQAFEELRDEFFNHLKRELKRQPTDKPLDKFLLDTLDSFESRYLNNHLCNYPTLAHLLRTVWNAIKEKTVSVDCAKCSSHCGLEPAVCDGINIEQDHQLVDKGGRCIEPLRRMYQIARSASTLYHDAYLKNPPQSYPELTFSTVPHDNKSTVHDLNVNFQVGGETIYTKKKSGSEVKLRLVPETFDRSSYDVTCYVLLHECVAHAFYAILPKALDREGPDDDDEFAEGWMDSVAYKVLEEIVDNRGPAHSLRKQIASPQDTLRRSTEYHSARFKRETQTTEENEARAESLNAGLTAIDRLESFLINELGQSREQAYSTIFRISLGLNTSKEFDDEDKRSGFVALMNSLPQNGEATRTHHDLIKSLLSQFIQNGDVKPFLARTYTLISNLAQ